MTTKKETSNTLISIMRGEFIAEESNRKYGPFLLMIVFLVLVNISSSFRAEKLLKQSISLEKEVADLRLVYITTKSDLMSMYRRSVIENIVNGQGLKTSLTPPIIIEK
tara:strand:+ start:342 stop:665 length:324 start_codon:yes stop_codon:yes gene_type:complete